MSEPPSQESITPAPPEEPSAIQAGRDLSSSSHPSGEPLPEQENSDRQLLDFRRRRKGLRWYLITWAVWPGLILTLIVFPAFFNGFRTDPGVSWTLSAVLADVFKAARIAVMVGLVAAAMGAGLGALSWAIFRLRAAFDRNAARSLKKAEREWDGELDEDEVAE